jgi:hypothetical protein
MKWQEVHDDCVGTSFMVCPVHRTLPGWIRQEWAVRVAYVAGIKNAQKILDGWLEMVFRGLCIDWIMLQLILNKSFMGRLSRLLWLRIGSLTASLNVVMIPGSNRRQGIAVCLLSSETHTDVHTYTDQWQEFVSTLCSFYLFCVSFMCWESAAKAVWSGSTYSSRSCLVTKLQDNIVM